MGKPSERDVKDLAAGLVRGPETTAAPLTTKRRNALPESVFAIPETRSYPIHDIEHARNALARSSGKPENARVKAAVYRKYPQLKTANT